MKFHIYKILCKSNSRYYIGMSQEFEKRKRSHINQLRLGQHNNYNLQKDFILYGENNFEFMIINEFSNKEDCKIEEMKLVNIEDNLLYNIIKDTSIGGDAFTHNPRKEEIRIKRIDQMSGKNNHQYGKPKTEKMINSVKEANSKKVKVQDLIFESQTDCAKYFKIAVGTVSNRIKSRNFKEWQYYNA